MVKNLCSFCCCSCCGLFSPSTPQSSQQQQQPISSSPVQPSTTSAHFSSSQSSQQHQTMITAPSSSGQEPTLTDFKKLLQKFKDATQIHTLIPLLEELLKIASEEKGGDGGSNSAAGSYIQDGRAMLEMLNKRIGKRRVKKNSGDGTVEEIQKVCVEVLKGSDKIPKVGIALSMLGYVIERFDNTAQNRKECLYVLERMVDLGKQILKLNELIPDQKKKLDDGVGCIIEGIIMCISQLARHNIFSFLTATVNKESLKTFQLKVDRLYSDIVLMTGIRIVEKVSDIEKRVPKIASESQKSYAYQQRVGSEGAKEKVIQLLDLNTPDTIPVVVVVCGFGGIGKTTLADDVYAHLNLESYKHCRIVMDQDCTKNDLKDLQQQILYGLFKENIKLNNCDQGQGSLWKAFKNNTDKPLFLYIDNGLKRTDLEHLLPKDLDNCLPSKSRILITTRNLNETDIFTGTNIVRREYYVNPLPETESRKLLLKRVSDYNDGDNIANLLKLCGGVPLLLELAGSQLAINKGNKRNIVLEMLHEGTKVKERDISDRMVGFVYERLESPVQEAFLDITSFFYDVSSAVASSRVGEEEFRALEAASFVKTSQTGEVIVHDIVRARGKKLSEGNRIRDDLDSLSECLKDNEKLKKIRGIYLHDRFYKERPIEINCHHLDCMSASLRVLRYNVSHITFREKCQKTFDQLRCLRIDGNIPTELPMEFEKLDHLVYYNGPFTQGMNWYEFPPSLRFCTFTRSKYRVEYSEVPPNVTPPSSLVQLSLHRFTNMERLPDGVEKLTKLERLALLGCQELRELPSKLTDLSDLRQLTLYDCKELKELPSNFGQFKNLERLDLFLCPTLAKLPSDFGQLKKLKNLDLSYCSGLGELPLDFGELQNLEQLILKNCSMLQKWPLNFEDLTKLKEINLEGCSSKLKDSLPKNITENNCKVIITESYEYNFFARYRDMILT